MARDLVHQRPFFSLKETGGKKKERAFKILFGKDQREQAVKLSRNVENNYVRMDIK